MILSHNRKVAFGLILVLIVIAVLMFDTLFELLLELIHVSFEFVEEMLDLFIGHIFHTDLHNTQIIVFYLMWAMAGYPLYRLYKLLRTLPRRYREARENLTGVCLQVKKVFLAYWQDLPLAGKAKWLMGFMTSITCMVFWVIS